VSRRGVGSVAGWVVLGAFLGVAATPSAAVERKVGLRIDLEPAPLAASFTAVGFAGLAAPAGSDPLTAAPAGVRIAFDGAGLTADLLPGEPQVLIFPVPSYEELLGGEARESLENHLEHLENLISGSGRVSGYLEPVPRPAERLRFRARVEMLAFRSGRVVRFVGGYARTAGAPARLAYTAQGLTADGLFLVTLFWPVEATGFVPPEEPGASGVALDALPAEAFRPSLAALDALVGSLSVKR
jgi:hypothetical protein